MLTNRSQKRGVGSSLKRYVYRSDQIPLILKNIYCHNPKIAEEEKVQFISNPEFGEIKGKILASTLQGLTTLASYGFDVDYKNKILLVDSMDISFKEALIEFEKLTKISLIKEVSCISIGAITNRKTLDGDVRFPELSSRVKQEAFVEDVEKMFPNIPVLYGFPVGHTRYKLTIPLGVNGCVDPFTGDITLLEDYLNI